MAMKIEEVELQPCK